MTGGSPEAKDFRAAAMVVRQQGICFEKRNLYTPTIRDIPVEALARAFDNEAEGFETWDEYGFNVPLLEFARSLLSAPARSALKGTQS